MGVFHVFKQRCYCCFVSYRICISRCLKNTLKVVMANPDIGSIVCNIPTKFEEIVEFIKDVLSLSHVYTFQKETNPSHPNAGRRGEISL